MFGLTRGRGFFVAWRVIILPGNDPEFLFFRAVSAPVRRMGGWKSPGTWRLAHAVCQTGCEVDLWSRPGN